MENQNPIVVDHGIGGKLANIFNCTNAMVSKALKGHTNTELAIKIRYVAITQYGGKEMTYVEPKKINAMNTTNSQNLP